MCENPAVIIEQVALYLGPPWKLSRLGEPCQWRFEIIDGNGHGLIFRIDNHKKRFEVSGHFPRSHTSPYRDDYKTIGVSMARPPKDIAADVARRLIPHYLAAFACAAGRYRQEQEKEQELALIAQALVKVTGGRFADHSGRSSRTVYFDKGEAEIWHDGEVGLNLRRLSPELAIRIAAML